MPRPTRFSPEVRARAVRMVMEHGAAHDSQWAAITSIAEKIGCTAETLRKWVRQAERDAGTSPGLTTEERERLKQLPSRPFHRRMLRHVQMHRSPRCRRDRRHALAGDERRDVRVRQRFELNRPGFPGGSRP